MFRTIKALFGALKGFRWSLYFVHKTDGLRYALHENSVYRLLGYVLGQLESGKHIGSDWELYINFNWEHKAIKLEERYFLKESFSAELQEKISGVDPEWMVRGGEPVFVDTRTNKKLPLGWAIDATYQSSEERMKSTFKMLDREGDEGRTLGSVMREVLGEKGT